MARGKEIYMITVYKLDIKPEGRDGGQLSPPLSLVIMRKMG